MSANNPSLWNFLVIFTIVIGITVTVLILDKERYFPSLYAHVDSTESHSDAAAHQEKMSSDSTHEIASEITDPVRNEVPLKSEPEAHTEETRQPSAGEYVLVAGSFLSEDYARKFQSSLQEKISDMRPEVVPFTMESTTYYRVVAFHASAMSEVLSAKRSIEEAGYSQSWIFRN